MKFVPLDPPGTWCQNQAFLEILQRCSGKQFLEVGCGGGLLSQLLCDRGFQGKGIDFSVDALVEAQWRLGNHIQDKRYELLHGDFMKMRWEGTRPDLAFSMMVVEHVSDDAGFVRKMAEAVRSNGYVVVGAPGRKTKWSIEDESVGHLRRYERWELEKLLTEAGLKEVEVWSVSVPTANLLFWLGNQMVKRSGEKERAASLSLQDQTQHSGIREIPFKTVFPAFFKLFLNRITLYPLFLIQRLFYRSNLGLTLIAVGRVGA